MALGAIGDEILLSLSSSLDNLSLGISYTIARKYIRIWSNLLIAVVNGTTTLAVMLAGDRVKQFLPPDIASYIGASIFLFLSLLDFWSFVQLMRSSESSSTESSHSSSTDKLLDNGVDETETEIKSPLLPQDDQVSTTLTNSNPPSTDSVASSPLLSISDEAVALLPGQTESEILFPELPVWGTSLTLKFPGGVPVPWKEIALIAFGTSFTNVGTGLAASLAGYNAYAMAVTAVVTNFTLLLLGQIVGANFGVLIPEKFLKLVSSLVLLGIALPYFLE